MGVFSPVKTLCFWLALLVISIPGLLQLSVETSTESVLDKKDPAWAFYQRSQDLFGGDESVVVGLKSSAPFHPDALRAVGELASRFEGAPGVRRVDSISTQPIVLVDSDGTLHLDPASEGFGEDPTLTVDLVGLRALQDRILPRLVLSDTGDVLAVNLLLERNPSTFYEGLLREVKSGMAELAPAGHSVWLSGVPVFQYQTSRQTQRELLAFAPLAVLCIGGLIALAFRSFRPAAFLLGSGAVGNALMLSAIGASAIPLSFTMVILPPIVLALAAAYGMHPLTAAASCGASADGRRDDNARRQELSESLGGVATPVALSGLTTAIGFLASSVIEIDAVRFVGAFGALGVLAVVALTLTALPACLSLWPLPARQPRGFSWLRESMTARLTRLATQSRRLTILVWGALAFVAALGLRDVSVDTDATRWFREGTMVRDHYEEIRAQLSGISPMNVVIEVEEASAVGVLAPELLVAIDQLSDYLESLPEVGKSISIADPLRQIHAGFAGAGSRGPGLPGSSALAEQYLLLLESVEQIDDLVTGDRQQANVALRVDNNGSAQLLAVAAAAEAWWREHGPPRTSARATGVMFEFGRAQDAIAWGQATGLAVALACIGVLLFAVFGRVAATAATLAPNLLPLLGIYGFMGFAGIPLDAGTVLVGSLALGIAVDDTVHLASAYYGEVEHSEPAEALRRSIQKVLPALTYTTLIVGLGFFLLAFSQFSFIRNLGVLMAAVMALCFVADIQLLPALMTLSGRAAETDEVKGA